MNPIQYSSGYKYVLKTAYSRLIPVKGFSIHTDFISLNPHGYLLIKKGYAWDGPSGPCPDLKSFMRASLVHDALYQLIREGDLSLPLKLQSDKIFKDICIEDGVPKFLATLAFWIVKNFAYTALKPISIKKAP